MKVFTISLVALLISSCTSAPSRGPSSMTKELSIHADYRGYQFVLSDNMEDEGSTKSIQEDLANSLCEKVGADSGSFIEPELVDFGHRGPDWASSYDEKTKKFVLVEKDRFITAGQLICSFSREVKCSPDYTNYTFVDIISGDLSCN